MQTDAYRVRPGHRVRLDDWDTRDDGGQNRQDAETKTGQLQARMQNLQERLYAEGKRSLLIVLQARDAGGKDGTVKHVMGGFNPLGTSVTPFKVPSAVERAHDFLWRVHALAPAAGHVAIFNRSHYEDVLVPRVHRLLPEEVLDRRLEHIRAFEALLADAQTVQLKFYLHISKEEQRKRLQERLDRPDKHWKFDPKDLEERALWERYTETYEQVLSRTSEEYAPWYVIPADRKWFRNHLITRILVETLEGLDLRYPPAPEGLEHVRIE
ncbi:PPK2 family polyphosphate:nucleotide phosphotransferase [Deinobacterium chartae]|uniref:PPK2 family polyphosphate:nucleotide phosphotransferase n=1 Tax=Deinobacterium chartae TaxID=521158 RepID=A0A841I1D8_9DEIO|nr:polyphosphate kinase 2 family protein [Deinobacterium chartae]MBB6097775.1 PPK2 family polyphosphate:nucleotide phosphotransferase [Deinobacterium chartae]